MHQLKINKPKPFHLPRLKQPIDNPGRYNTTQIFDRYILEFGNEEYIINGDLPRVRARPRHIVNGFNGLHPYPINDYDPVEFEVTFDTITKFNDSVLCNHLEFNNDNNIQLNFINLDETRIMRFYRCYFIQWRIENVDRRSEEVIVNITFRFDNFIYDVNR